MSGQELALRQTDLTSPEVIERAKLALRDASPAEVGNIRDQAAVLEAYAKTKNAREQALAAGEIRLWAERRAGQIRLSLPRVKRSRGRKFDREEARRLRAEGLSQAETARRLGVGEKSIWTAEKRGWPSPTQSGIPPLREFDSELGVIPRIAKDWERLGEVPEDSFTEAIAQARATDGALTPAAILGRCNRYATSYIEPGMLALADGRLQIRWRRNGVEHSKTLSHSDKARAREALAVARGKLAPHKKSRRALSINAAKQDIRSALEILDRLDPRHFDDRAKRGLEDAIAGLHKAEDGLVIASLNVGNKSRSPSEPPGKL